LGVLQLQRSGNAGADRGENRMIDRLADGVPVQAETPREGSDGHPALKQALLGGEAEFVLRLSGHQVSSCSVQVLCSPQAARRAT